MSTKLSKGALSIFLISISTAFETNAATPISELKVAIGERLWSEKNINGNTCGENLGQYGLLTVMNPAMVSVIAIRNKSEMLCALLPKETVLRRGPTAPAERRVITKAEDISEVGAKYEKGGTIDCKNPANECLMIANGTVINMEAARDAQRRFQPQASNANPSQNQTRQSEALAEYGRRMTGQELSLVREKIAANPKKASASQLSDESNVTPLEKDTISKWLQVYQNYASDDLREVGSKYPYVLTARQKYHRGYEDLIVTLHSGKITFGEFNRKNRTLQDAFDGHVALLNERRQQERAKQSQGKLPSQVASATAQDGSTTPELGRVYDPQANAFFVYQRSACRIERYKNTYPLHFEAKLKDTGGIIVSGCYRVNNSDKEIISVGPNGKEVRFPIQHILSGASGGPGSEVNQGNSYLGNTLKFLQGAANEWNRIDQTDPFTRRRMQECPTNFGEQAWIDCVKGRGPTR